MRTQKYLFLVQELSYYTARTQQEQDAVLGHQQHTGNTKSMGVRLSSSQRDFIGSETGS